MTKLPREKARSVGVSNFTIGHVSPVLLRRLLKMRSQNLLYQIETIINDTGVVPAVNQIERHPRLPNTAMVDYCFRRNILVTAYSAFGNNSFGLPLLVNTPEVKAVAERLSAATGKQVTGAQVALAWSQVGGHAVIPKSVTPSRIWENFQEVELDDEAVKALDMLAKDGRRFNIPTTCESDAS